MVALKLAWARIAAEGKGEQQVNEQMRMFLVRAIGLANPAPLPTLSPARRNRTIVRFALGKSAEHLLLGLEYLIKCGAERLS